MDVLPALHKTPEEVDWPQVEAQWGAVFPGDYKDFIGTYGFGTIENYLDIASPVDYGNRPGMLSISHLTPDPRILEELDSPYPAWPDQSGLIGWGGNADADVAYWKTSRRPEDWRVIVWRRHRRPGWAEFDVGFADFLRAVITRELPVEPFSGTDLYDHGLPKFLDRREERRLRETGVNPWAHLFE